MPIADPKSLSPIGFLTIVRHSEHGLFGGYLILNAVGRPIEFHCTAPVKPNRAQEILYGTALEPFLCGEQIGQTLIAHAGVTPALVFTDVAAAMEVRRHVELAVSLVTTADQTSDLATDEWTAVRVDGPHAMDAQAIEPEAFSLADCNLSVSAEFPHDRNRVLQAWPSYSARIELQEPFVRIREAIQEAQRGAC